MCDESADHAESRDDHHVSDPHRRVQEGVVSDAEQIREGCLLRACDTENRKDEPRVAGDVEAFLVGVISEHAITDGEARQLPSLFDFADDLIGELERERIRAPGGRQVDRISEPAVPW